MWMVSKTHTWHITGTWWRHQMEIFSALLAICAGNSPVTGEFPTQRPVTRSFDVYFDLRPNERLSKQWWGWWFETLSRSLWRHRNEIKWNVDCVHFPRLCEQFIFTCSHLNLQNVFLFLYHCCILSEIKLTTTTCNRTLVIINQDSFR